MKESLLSVLECLSKTSRDCVDVVVVSQSEATQMAQQAKLIPEFSNIAVGFTSGNWGYVMTFKKLKGYGVSRP